MIEARVTRPRQTPERPKFLVSPSLAIGVTFTIIMSTLLATGLILSTPIPERE